MARTRDLFVACADARRESKLGAVLRRVSGLPSDALPVYWYVRQSNFGDAMSPAIVAHVSGMSPVWVSASARGKVLAVGSNHHHIRAGDTVWGCGAMYERQVRLPAGAHVLAVRGPTTRSLIEGDVPEIYGDPAVLLPEFCPRAHSKRWEVGVVPHFLDQAVMQVEDPAMRQVDVTADWTQVVDEITSCEVIVSSSLHGLIVAEAYGIPAVWVTASDRVRGAALKFNDFFLGTGRPEQQPLQWARGLSSIVGSASAPPRLESQPLIDAWLKG